MQRDTYAAALRALNEAAYAALRAALRAEGKNDDAEWLRIIATQTDKKVDAL